MLYADNGYDPVLGPPYPPVNYMLEAHGNQQPRLTWNVPDVIITVQTEVTGGPGTRYFKVYLILANYDFEPPATVFELWRFVSGAFTKVAQSDVIDDGPFPPVGSTPYHAWDVGDQIMWALTYSDEVLPYDETFYVAATSGATTVYSNNVNVTYSE